MLIPLIAECTTPGDVFDVEVPKCYKSTLPTEPPFKCNKTLRKPCQDWKKNQSPEEEFWIKCLKKHYGEAKAKGNENELRLDEIVDKIRRRGNEETKKVKKQIQDPLSSDSVECNASVSSTASSYQTAKSSTTNEEEEAASAAILSASQPPSYYSAESSEKLSAHVSSEAILEELEDHIAFLCLYKQVKFNMWMKEVGFTQALKRLRMQVSVPKISKPLDSSRTSCEF